MTTQYSYGGSVPLQNYSTMEQIRNVLRETKEQPVLILVSQNGCTACEKQIAEIRKYLFYKTVGVYKVEAREFNASLPEEYRLKEVPVVYKGHASYGLRFGKNGIMSLEEIQSFMV